MKSRSVYATLYLFCIVAAYVLKWETEQRELWVRTSSPLLSFSFNRVCICILALHYGAEFIYHVARLTHFTEKSSVATALLVHPPNCCNYFRWHFLLHRWKVWNGAFILVRLGCVTLAVLTFWYGLRISESPHMELSAGNFNTAFIRLVLLISPLTIQRLFIFLN